MLLTPDQRRAVSRDDRNSLLVACPGSGKTRTIVAKLLRSVEEVRGTSRRIACITYTNAAVYEIESRLRTYGRGGDDVYFDVSTIHAFCLNQVLRHFYWRLPDYADGFSIAAPESDEFDAAVREVADAHRLQQVAKAREGFELLSREPDGTPILPAGSVLTHQMAQEFWRRLAERELMDFSSIVFLTFRLLTDRPSLVHALACRFAWVLVDEFQDTSALQVEILRMIATRNRTRFFLVGDPYQSIFGFAGARPDLMEAFADEIGAEREPSLAGNFRSSTAIIAHAERLCSRTRPMLAVGQHAKFSFTPQHVHVASAFEAITDYFLPALDELGIRYGKAAILAPWWIKLLHLGRKLREYGVPIVGPGARPYKRDRLFSTLAEPICAYIEQPDGALVPRIERGLFELVLQATGKSRYDLYSYQGRVTVFRLIKAGRRIRDENPGAVAWLEAAAVSFTEILTEDELMPRALEALLPSSVADICDDMIERKIDTANLSVADLGLFAVPDGSLKLLTMHKAKGREFAAVAVIDLHDGRVPHFSAITAEEIDDGRRLLYVAITRAERVLMYVTDDEDSRNAPSRFLGADGLGLAPA